MSDVLAPMPVYYCDTTEENGGVYVAAPTRNVARRLAMREIYDCEFIDVRARLARELTPKDRKRAAVLTLAVDSPRVLTEREVWDLTGFGACAFCGQWDVVDDYGGLCDVCRPRGAANA